MPSIETTNISSAVAQTAHPSTNSSIRATQASTSPSQLARVSQQAAAITAVTARDDAVRVTRNPKRVEGIFAVQKDKQDDSRDPENPENSDEAPQGQSEGPVKKRLSMRV